MQYEKEKIDINTQNNNDNNNSKSSNDDHNKLETDNFERDMKKHIAIEHNIKYIIHTSHEYCINTIPCLNIDSIESNIPIHTLALFQSTTIVLNILFDSILIENEILKSNKNHTHSKQTNNENESKIQSVCNQQLLNVLQDIKKCGYISVLFYCNNWTLRYYNIEVK
jgi:hypothetical protein